MIYQGAKSGAINLQAVLMEILTSMRRAGMINSNKFQSNKLF